MYHYNEFPFVPEWSCSGGKGMRDVDLIRSTLIPCLLVRTLLPVLYLMMRDANGDGESGGLRRDVHPLAGGISWEAWFRIGYGTFNRNRTRRTWSSQWLWCCMREVAPLAFDRCFVPETCWLPGGGAAVDACTVQSHNLPNPLCLHVRSLQFLSRIPLPSPTLLMRRRSPLLIPAI